MDDVALPPGYEIRELLSEDAAALADAYRRNRDHLRQWDPRRDPDFYTEEGQAAAVAGQLASVKSGLSATWVITHGDQIVGRVNLNNIVMAVLRSANVGYWVDAVHLRRGLATAAVLHACQAARDGGLHRVEAGTQVANEASQAVLLRCGFELFGCAPKFLFVDGAWRDHNLYQRILHDDPI